MDIQIASIIAFMLGLVGLAVLPLGGLWALNTLFGTALEYNFVNWAAVLFSQVYLQLLLKASITKKSLLDENHKTK